MEHGPMAAEAFKDHWKETNGEEYGKPFKHSHEYFQAMERVGALFVLVGLDANGALSAYAFGTKMAHIMCTDITVGSVQGLYIKPECRGAGLRFIKFINKFLEDRDVDRIEYQTGNNEALVRYLERTGFHISDKTLSRRT